MRHSAEVSATIAELRRWGADLVNVEMGGKHVRVRYRWNGAERFMVTAASGSDRRGPANARQAVRHALGVVGKKPRPPESARPSVRGLDKPPRKPVQPRSPAPPPLVPIPARPSPWAILGRTPAGQAALAVEADRAWRALFLLHLLNADHEPASPQIRAAVGEGPVNPATYWGIR